MGLQGCDDDQDDRARRFTGFGFGHFSADLAGSDDTRWQLQAECMDAVEDDAHQFSFRSENNARGRGRGASIRLFQ